MSTDLSPPDRLPFEQEPVGAVQVDLQELRRQYAAALRLSEEHGLPLTRRLTRCCGKSIWLNTSPHEGARCPHCGRHLQIEATA